MALCTNTYTHIDNSKHSFKKVFVHYLDTDTSSHLPIDIKITHISKGSIDDTLVNIAEGEEELTTRGGRKRIY